MIALTLVCVALVALCGYQHHTSGKERERLYTARTVHHAPPLAPPVADDSEPPAWVAPDDDSAYQDALRERG